MKKHNIILFSLISFIVGYIVYKIKVSENVLNNNENELVDVKNNDIGDNIKVNNIENFKNFNDYSYKKRNYISLKGMGENF